MANEERKAAAVAIGQKRADETLQRRRAAHARRAAALAAHPAPIDLKARVTPTAIAAPAASTRTAGFLLALGDSWFDYPFHDVLTKLDDEHGYNIESAAHRGDPIETMAYTGGQIDDFARCLEKITSQGAMPNAVLISGGGDDIAGSEFGMLLNSAVSPIGGWNTEVIDGVINDRVLTAYSTILASVNQYSQQTVGRTFPILVHGYDYPVPDGRGVLWGWPFPGPWLQPGFREKGFDDLSTNVQFMRVLIDRFNQMLASFAATTGAGQVRYVDIRNTLSTVLTDDAYKNWWANELHPTETGFSAVANKFAAVLTAL